MSAPAPATNNSPLETELDLHQIKQRSITGALAFVSRTILLYGIGLVAFALLSGLLTIEQIGIYIIVDATVNILVYFSDVGLAAALIQKKSRLSRLDLTTTFTIQQVLVVGLVLLAFVFSTQIGAFFDYGQEAVNLYKALVFAFFLSSLKTIPSILLERDLQFNRLIIPQILENLVFYTLVVLLALRGFGVTSYTYAVLARGFVGLIVIYILKPWLPGFSFDIKIAKGLVNFGAPFQLYSILALIKDRVLILFLGKFLGPGPVGLLGWAEKWAQMPIRFVADPILRVTFPAYSRLQHNQPELKKAVEKSVYFVSFLTFPMVVGIIAIAPVILDIVPRYAQWQPALIALGLYGINTLFSSISITLTNTLNATGKVTLSLKLMVMWTILTWLLTPSLIHLFGFNGAALASALTASSSLIAYYLVRQIVDISLAPQIMPPLLATAIMFLVVFTLRNYLPVTVGGLFALIISGSISYLAIIYSINSRRITAELKIVFKYLKQNTSHV